MSNTGEASLGILVDARGQAMQTKVRWVEPIVIFKAEQVDLCLKDSGSVGKLRRLDGPKEDVTPSTIIEMEVELLLKAKIEKELLGKREDIINP